MSGMSIYEQIGGPDAVAAAVERFYQRVLADPDLAPFFAGTDLGSVLAPLRSQIVNAPESRAS